MSEPKPVPPLPEGIVDDELLQRISGGDCTLTDVRTAIEQAQQTYEQLIDFTSYMIERVANSLQ